MTMIRPPERGGEKSKPLIKKEGKKRGRKWVTWMSVDGVPVPGSEVEHDTMGEALKWCKGEKLN
jgi:hypothetical protein